MNVSEVGGTIGTCSKYGFKQKVSCCEKNAAAGIVIADCDKRSKITVSVFGRVTSSIVENVLSFKDDWKQSF